MDKYEDVLKEHIAYIYLQEDLKNVVKRLADKAKMKVIQSAVKTKDPSKFMKAIAFLPKVSADSLYRVARRRIPGFDSEYNLVYKKLKNKVPEDAAKLHVTSFVLAKRLIKIAKDKGQDTSKVDPKMNEWSKTFLDIGGGVVEAGAGLTAGIVIIWYLLTHFTSWTTLMFGIGLAIPAIELAGIIGTLFVGLGLLLMAFAGILHLAGK